jgi:hypothetical protein
MDIEFNEIFHPRVLESGIPLFEKGFFQQAALESMKQVEMALREKGLAPRDLFGDRLVKWVMGSGDHITLSIPLGEEFQEKARMLFRGAFGYYRNYVAHDGAKIDRKTCYRILALASELLDLLDASKRSFEGNGGIEGLIKSGVFKNAKEFRDLLDFLEGQQFIDCDYSEYESDLVCKGFNKIQVEAVFDFGFVKMDEWETGIDLEAGLFSSTYIEQIKLTDEGVRIWEESGK